ncbi:MAG TPA: twin-arginine translocase TatA/TatE family subunit [Thermoanaerobaculia bacterium]
MFGSLGVPELILIFVVALIVFGPRRIPEIGRTLGKALGEFRRATDDLKSSIEREVRLEELKKVTSPINTTLDSITSSFDSLSKTEPLPPLEPSPVPEPDPAAGETSTEPPASSESPEGDGAPVPRTEGRVD